MEPVATLLNSIELSNVANRFAAIKFKLVKKANFLNTYFYI